MFAFIHSSKQTLSKSNQASIAISDIDSMSMEDHLRISSERRQSAIAAEKADLARREAEEKAAAEKAKAAKANKGKNKVDKVPATVSEKPAEVDVIPATVAPAVFIPTGSSEKPVDAVFASTRVELRVNNPDGTETLVASVDSANTGAVEEKSLEDKIREAMAVADVNTSASPMANAMKNFRKGNQHRNNQH